MNSIFRKFYLALFQDIFIKSWNKNKIYNVKLSIFSYLLLVSLLKWFAKFTSSIQILWILYYLILHFIHFQIQIEVMLTGYILGNVVNSDALIKGGMGKG